MRTLYEMLEVSETASKEIIEKAYRTLAKKYHPDLQTEENKQVAENKMKELNEAYGVLSDVDKRKAYDAKLAMQRQEQREREQEAREQEAIRNQNINYSNYQTYNDARNNQQPYNKQRPMTQAEYREAKKREQEEIRKRQKMQQKMQQQMQADMQAQYEQKYQQAYEDYLRSLGYKIKYKWTWKKWKELFLTILIIAGICTILWIFPPTHKLIVDFYYSNAIVKTVVDVIGRILIGIWNAICSFF